MDGSHCDDIRGKAAKASGLGISDQAFYKQAAGCVLPCVSLGANALDALRVLKGRVEEGGLDASSGLPLVAQQTCERSAWQVFAGIVPMTLLGFSLPSLTSARIA